MQSLFGIKANWRAYLIILILIRLILIDISWLSYFAIAVTLHQCFLMFYAIGNVLPVRYLTGTLMCIQLLVGAVLAYNGLDKYQFIKYTMQVSEVDYFTYTLPAVIAFIIGLHISAKKLRGETANLSTLLPEANARQALATILIFIAILADVLKELTGSSFQFVFYLLGALKFVGAFILIFSGNKWRFALIGLVILSLVFSALQSGMFYDLIVWLVFIGVIFALRYKPSTKLKLALSVIFLLLVVSIQLIKKDFRVAISKSEDVSEVEALQDAVEKTTLEKSKNIWVYLASQNVRINQGFIVSYLLKNVPAKVPFSEGKTLMAAIEASILPRFIAPEKLASGDRAHFVKYTGMALSKRTSMSLSAIGEGYINFGFIGGCIFMFLLGFFYSSVLNTMYFFYKRFPLLIVFVPFVFFYPIRPDTDIQTALGHLVKSLLVLIVIHVVWEKYFLHYQKQPLATSAT